MTFDRKRLCLLSLSERIHDVDISIIKTLWKNPPYQSFDEITANFFTYLSLGYCYFHFINLGETARRIRILRELYDSKQGLSEKEILEKYNAEEIVVRRINRLMSNGQILYRDDRYYINSPIMLLISKIIIVLKLLFLGKKVAG